ncbi:MAG: S9 family peptidase, partial [Acidobacteriota bacterium]|nr:S9 family peptidase [Acidobacteriota bacterium]
MRLNKLASSLCAVLALVSLAFGQQAVSTANKLAYPETRKAEQVDNFHGMSIADPYRWLEDLDSPATQAWVEAQNKLTFGYLAQIPQRASIKDRLTKLWNYERYGIPFKEGKRFFYTKNDGLQNQSVLYTVTSLDAPPVVLLDPN